MKKFSFAACILITLFYCTERIVYSDAYKRPDLKVTIWDALGYYMYLPSVIIYNDYKKLTWFPAIDSEYHVSGGELYQALQLDDGSGYYYKYLGGVSILQLPFFLAAHIYAKNFSHYKADGFSPPYQYAIAFGNVIYFIIALFFLRKFLLLFFTDEVTTATLLLTTLATNLIQYVAIDSGMSHGYIFPLYVLILWASYKWHQKPNVFWAAVIGYCIGIATISRPTEAIMLFIPLLWNTHNKEASQQKWQLVKKYRSHLFIVLAFGFLGILPQLLYWKSATGNFIYDVGSKWTFLNPFFRVLFGWEKGWFIYTPVTIFFIVGLFFIKKYPFKNSVIWFCALNIYIIISWFDWRYGGSYSTRALSQSYPVFALSLAGFIQFLSSKKWKIIFYALGIYLIALNIFQVWQYNENILHYNDMNQKYYAAIYWKAHPTPLDMSLLDTDDFLKNESAYKTTVLLNKDTFSALTLHGSYPLADTTLFLKERDWLKVTIRLKIFKGIYGASIKTSLEQQTHSFRLANAISREGENNMYEFYLKSRRNGYQHLIISIEAQYLSGKPEFIAIERLEKR